MGCRIWVYTICKNEEKFVPRFMAWAKEADGVAVLDTGSTDNTVRLLRQWGAVVKTRLFTPFRFDKARNASLDLVPEDAELCVCADLDEVFEPGWRQKLEAAYSPAFTRYRYKYTWRFAPDGTEVIGFVLDKIHARHGFCWTHPVHEVLTEASPGKALFLPGVWCKHYPDHTKSRSSYLPLLELSVAEAPEDDRNMHYLAREYYFYGQYEKAIETFNRHLALPSANWADERCASYRYMAKCYTALKQAPLAEQALLKGVAEASHLREPWLELAQLYLKQKHYDGVVYACLQALKIQNRPATYITVGAYYKALPYDLLSLGYYYTGRKGKALQALEQALAFEPDNPRLLKNKSFMV